jgi:hypothetical protein
MVKTVASFVRLGVPVKKVPDWASRISSFINSIIDIFLSGNNIYWFMTKLVKIIAGLQTSLKQIH